MGGPFNSCVSITPRVAQNRNIATKNVVVETPEFRKTAQIATQSCSRVQFCAFSVCLCLLNHMFDSHSCCRLSYRRPSTWTAMSWLCPTTCLYITIPSMGEGLADSTLQKVRLLIWRMVGTFFTSYNLPHPSPHPRPRLILPFFEHPANFFQATLPRITPHLVASSSHRNLLSLHHSHVHSTQLFFLLLTFLSCFLPPSCLF